MSYRMNYYSAVVVVGLLLVVGRRMGSPTAVAVVFSLFALSCFLLLGLQIHLHESTLLLLCK